MAQETSEPPNNAQAISQTISAFGIELDSLQAQQKKNERAYRLNVFFIPLLRLAGYTFLSISIILHNYYLLGESTFAGGLSFALVGFGYTALTWILLLLFFRRITRIHLGDFFLILEVAIFTYGVYCSGGEKSWLFLMAVARGTDQTATTVKRAAWFAVGSLCSYIALICYLDFIEHHQVHWGIEAAKIIFMIAFLFPIVGSARIAERVRASFHRTIHMAQDFTSHIGKQTAELEAARANLEKLYHREQEVTRTLSELNQMKTNFLIVTSHEMRTPLTVIKGYNEALLNQFFGSLSDTQKKSLEACQHVVDRLTMTVEDILEMLKINEGHLKLKVTDFDFADLLRQISSDMSLFLEKRRQCLDLQVPATLELRADREKIHLVMLNLIQNAIKFTPDEGTIQVTAARNGETVRIAVTDSGIGIEPAEIEKIFEKFYLNEDPLYHTSGKYQYLARGTGLGLSIAKSYVECHQGKIWAESVGKNQGSTFHVILPLRAQAEEDSANPPGR
ncbi:MAG: hypothetical protein K1Y36_16260 [Blastocatellia bacterium]|nr:hypothetical protein [Blastocatellia bacterium]